MFKKLKYFLSLLDFIWSVPLAYIFFIVYGIVGEHFFGEGFGFYDPSFFQAALYAVLTLVLFNGVAFVGLWFNFRTVFRYYTTQSKKDYESLSPLQKIGIFFGIWGFFILILFFIWLKIV